MNVPVRLLAFLFAVALAVGGGWAIGAAVGPIDQPDRTPAHSTPTPTTMAPGAHHGMSR